MNKILIVDASASDGRIMAGLLTRAGYNPVVTDCIEAGKVEAAKLPPGAVIVTAMRLSDGTAREYKQFNSQLNKISRLQSSQFCRIGVLQKSLKLS